MTEDVNKANQATRDAQAQGRARLDQKAREGRPVGSQVAPQEQHESWDNAPASPAAAAARPISARDALDESVVRQDNPPTPTPTPEEIDRSRITAMGQNPDDFDPHQVPPGFATSRATREQNRALGGTSAEKDYKNRSATSSPPHAPAQGGQSQSPSQPQQRAAKPE